GVVLIREREVWIDYDVEERADGGPFGVARLRLPEKMARTLVDDELPVLDRPLRFAVLRGQRGAVRAKTLDELQDLLDQPWSPAELDDHDSEIESPYAKSDDDPRRQHTRHERHRRP